MNSTETVRKFAPVEFIRSTVVELRKVDWPSRQKTLQLTGIVIAVCIVFGVVVGALDIGLTRLVNLLLELKK